MRIPVRDSLAFLLISCPLIAGAADRIGIVTLLEGSATVVRDVARHALAEGVSFRPGDMIEVSAKGLAEIEFPEGAALAMGPGARVLAVAVSRGSSMKGDYYVTRGAFKLSRLKKGVNFRFVTPLFVLQPAEGATVFVLDAASASIFVESGAARLEEPAVKGPGQSTTLRSGVFYSRKEGQKGAVGARPAPAFISALPRIFLDPLPSRFARFKNRNTQPRRIDDVAYADVEDWLQAPRDIRRPLMSRFRPRVRDAEFRAALVKNLSLHPEWDPVLFPEKYMPKKPAPPAAGTAP